MGNILFPKTIQNRIEECDFISLRVFKHMRFVMLLFVIQMIFTLVKHSGTKTFFLYLTHLTAILCFLYYVVLATYYYLSDSRPTWLWKLAHFIFELSFTYSFIVTVVFWLLIVPLLLTMTNNEHFIDHELTFSDYFINVEVHGINFLCLVVDMYFNRIEFCWRHIVLIFIFGLAYNSILASYTLFTGNTIYPKLTFHSLLSVFYIVMAFGLCLIAYSLGVFFSYRKRRRYEKIESRRNTMIEEFFNSPENPEESLTGVVSPQFLV